MTITLQLTGYDRKTGRVAKEFPLPARIGEHVKAVARVPSEDPNVLGSYPLDEDQVSQIAGAARQPLNSREYDYYLEAYETPRDRSAA